ncbi:YcdB/YcdC domain-containing protein [Paenibacillus sp. JCM 10914]|uniref:YcdB/YcdC domain-containing protein n=1 Tax=Paenibacillus sp. JCM 10914 TaxID=1236974 RepID=UPI0005625986|nr:YcdB/YcdC domain-containing protein [Paenibacillus sp. JCM 10914]
MNSKQRGNKNVRVKQTVSAVTAAAMLCLAQPAWGDPAVSETQAVVSNGSSSSEQMSLTDNEIPQGAKISSKQAENIIRKAFPELKNAQVTNAMLQDQDGMRTNVLAWDLQWSVSKGNTSTGFNSVINAVTGEIINVHIPGLITDIGKQDQPSLNREQAKEHALKWIANQVKGIKTSDLKENEAYLGMETALFSPPQHHFYFQTTVNGIESDVNSISIMLDGQGRVNGFSRNLTGDEFPSPTPAIDAATSRKQFEEDFKVELAYVPEKLYSNANGKYFLGYLPVEQSGLAMDANTGEFISNLGGEAEIVHVEDGTIPASSDTFAPVTSSLNGGDAAAKWVESQIKLPAELKVQSKSLGNRGMNGNSKTWSLMWREGDSFRPSGGAAHGEVDAKTGQIYSFYRYSYDPSEAPVVKNPIKQEAAIELAHKTVSKLVPNASAEWKLISVGVQNIEEQVQNYQFRYQRYADDIMIMGDSLYLSIDGSGQIISYNVSANAEISKLETNVLAKVTSEQAKAAFLKEIEMKLKYGYYGSFSTYYAASAPPKGNIKLIYYPYHQQSSFGGIAIPLDANTGKWRDITPGMGRGNTPIVTDISEHPAKAALDLIVKHNVMKPDSDGKIYPNQTISLGDWYQYIAASVSPSYEQMYGRSVMDPYAGVKPDHPYYPAIQVLLSQSWLPYEPEGTLQLERKLTRDELAASLMRVLNYEKLSQAFILPTDVQGVSDAESIQHKGAALIVLKLGLLKPVDGKFMPQREVTRAEAAEVLASLAKLAGSSDSFMSYNRW